RFEDENGSVGKRLDPDTEPAPESRAVYAPAFRSLANSGRSELFALTRIFDRSGSDVDRNPVAFLERPAARPLRSEVDLHRHIERGQEVAENEAGALGRAV